MTYIVSWIVTVDMEVLQLSMFYLLALLFSGNICVEFKFPEVVLRHFNFYSALTFFCCFKDPHSHFIARIYVDYIFDVNV